MEFWISIVIKITRQKASSRSPKHKPFEEERLMVVLGF